MLIIIFIKKGRGLNLVFSLRSSASLRENIVEVTVRIRFPLRFSASLREEVGEKKGHRNRKAPAVC